VLGVRAEGEEAGGGVGYECGEFVEGGAEEVGSWLVRSA